jgi:hypothetical protein
MALAMRLLQELLTKLFFLRLLLDLLPVGAGRIFFSAGMLARADFGGYSMSADANLNHLQVPQLQ